jgi:hypothetical protein
VANDAEARAVSHPFDIIVTADDASTLNENARACLHEGDDYYSAEGAQADLSAWELKYCLDNDTRRFAWADDTNGKGVVFWLKDDWNNECPYDFKQIQFKRYKITACEKAPRLVGTYLAAILHNTLYITKDLEDYIWAYTFSGTLEGSILDASTKNWSFLGFGNKYNHCYGNSIKRYIDKGNNTILLNNIVFLAETDICAINTFAQNCKCNTFGDSATRNAFGNNCKNNIFGEACQDNFFGEGCSINVSSYQFLNNSLGCECRSNVFDNGFTNNIFSDNCQNNIFGGGCAYNTFGGNFQKNTFGDGIWYSTFGNKVQNIEISKHCRNCVFGNNIQYVKLQNNNASPISPIQNYHVLGGLIGTSNEPVTIAAELGHSYCTYVGKNSSGVVKTWAPADFVQS